MADRTTSERINFGKLREVIQPPNLIEIQINSYLDFLQKGVPEKQRKPQRVGMRTGGDGTYTWRCVGKGTSPKWPRPEDSRFGCTGCGGTVGNMQSGSSSVRTRDSSVPGMA